MHASILKNASKAQVSGSKLARLAQIISNERQQKRLNEPFCPADALSLPTSRSSTPEPLSLDAQGSTPNSASLSLSTEEQPFALKQLNETNVSHRSAGSRPAPSDSLFPTSLKYKEELDALEKQLALLNEERQAIFQQLQGLLGASSDDANLTLAIERSSPASVSVPTAIASVATPLASLSDRLVAANSSGPSFGQPLESELSDVASEEEATVETSLQESLSLSLSLSVPIQAEKIVVEPSTRLAPLSTPAALPPSMQGMSMMELAKRPRTIESVIEDLHPHKLQRVEV